MAKPIPTFDISANQQGVLSRLVREQAASSKDLEAAFDPDDYEWAPNAQRSYSGTIASGKTSALPFEVRTAADDWLRNDTQYPMLVRSMMMYGISVGTTDRPVKVGSKKRGEPARWWQTPTKGFADWMAYNAIQYNKAKSNTGGLCAMRYAHLWKPYRFRQAESLMLGYGSASGGTWRVSGATGNMIMSVAGYGVESGKPYFFTDYFESQYKQEWRVDNVYGEDIYITDIASGGVGGNIASAIRFEPSMGPRLARSERDLSIISDFGISAVTAGTLSGQHVFDYMPHGALVLEPGEGIVAEIANQTGLTYYFGLYLHSYVVRAPKGAL